MNESLEYGAPKHAERMERKVALARELVEGREVFPFPGISEDVLIRMRKEESEYPVDITPIDEIIERCAGQGIKIALESEDRPENISPHVIPAEDGDLRMDGILLRHLQLEGVTDERLIELIMLDRSNS